MYYLHLGVIRAPNNLKASASSSLTRPWTRYEYPVSKSSCAYRPMETGRHISSSKASANRVYICDQKRGGPWMGSWIAMLQEWRDSVRRVRLCRTMKASTWVSSLNKIPVNEINVSAGKYSSEKSTLATMPTSMSLCSENSVRDRG